MKMDEFKLCNDGEFMPVSFPCPPPYSGPYYYYPYENIPLPPADQGDTKYNGISPSKGGAPISSGAVAGIFIIVTSILVMMCLITLKFRRRFNIVTRVSSRLNSRHAGESHLNSGDHMLVNIVGSGLEEKLVNLLPVCEYVGLMQEGKVDGRERHECAVCLSFFEEKEIVRVLPKCKHTFHLQCIDRWFESHANCPLCRERITLQTIQLSSNADSHNDQQPPLDPLIHQDLTLNNQISADFSNPHLHDQHVNALPLTHACVHNVHDQQDGMHASGLQDLNPHQNISLDATNINYTPTTEPYQYQNADHPVRYAAGGLLEQNVAGLTCTLPHGLCDHDTPPIHAVTVESMKYKHDAESKEDENSSNEAAKDAWAAHYIDDGKFRGPACGLQSFYDHQNALASNDRLQRVTGDDRIAGSQRECSQLEAHAVDIDDENTALASPSAEKSLMQSHIDVNTSADPTSRAFKLLKKSLSTGSLNIEADAKARNPFYGTTREMI